MEVYLPSSDISKYYSCIVWSHKSGLSPVTKSPLSSGAKCDCLNVGEKKRQKREIRLFFWAISPKHSADGNRNIMCIAVGYFFSWGSSQPWQEHPGVGFGIWCPPCVVSNSGNSLTPGLGLVLSVQPQGGLWADQAHLEISTTSYMNLEVISFNAGCVKTALNYKIPCEEWGLFINYGKIYSLESLVLFKLKTI